jgi:hypothetical protein
MATFIGALLPETEQVGVVPWELPNVIVQLETVTPEPIVTVP